MQLRIAAATDNSARGRGGAMGSGTVARSDEVVEHELRHLPRKTRVL
jgi:hypothetical protein